MDDRYNIMRYMNNLGPNSETRQSIESINRRNNNVLNFPYSMAPQPTLSYSDLDAMSTKPIDPFLDYQSPGLLSNLSTSLQVAQTAPKLLNMQVGKQTLGQTLGAKLSGPGTQIGNPFTTNVSAGSFTPQTQLGPTASAGGVSVQQGASNYFSNLKGGSVSAGLPTYIAGRVIRSAFDDDDPTSFTGGEMLGAGISGAGAGSALAPILGVSGPLGIGLGIAISLLGGRRKRNKARKLQQEYQTALKEREDQLRSDYKEGVMKSREQMQAEARTNQYLRDSAGFNNPYGMGNMEKGGKMPEYVLGGFFQSVLGGFGDAVTSIGGAATNLSQGTLDALTNLGFNTLDVTTDLAQTAAAPAFDAMEVVGENIIEPATENILQPALDTAFQGVEAGGELLGQGIEGGLNLAGDAMDLGFGAASSVMETAGKVAFPVIDFVGGAVAPFVQGIGEAITDPFMPDNDTTSLNSPLAPNIETVEGADAPNIVTVNPYSTDAPTKAMDFTMGSGSLGFIRPEDKEKENIYTSTQESV
tara:strand:- start:7161 stop:8744 length:1584 start_codon:yes stop_codon:yes gene_type:complete